MMSATGQSRRGILIGQTDRRCRDDRRTTPAAPPCQAARAASGTVAFSRLGLNAEVIAARIMVSVPPEKAGRTVSALNQPLAHWCAGTFNPLRPHVTGGGAWQG